MTPSLSFSLLISSFHHPKRSAHTFVKWINLGPREISTARKPHGKFAEHTTTSLLFSGCEKLSGIDFLTFGLDATLSQASNLLFISGGVEKHQHHVGKKYVCFSLALFARAREIPWNCKTLSRGEGCASKLIKRRLMPIICFVLELNYHKDLKETQSKSSAAFVGVHVLLRKLINAISLVIVCVSYTSLCKLNSSLCCHKLTLNRAMPASTNIPAVSFCAW